MIRFWCRHQWIEKSRTYAPPFQNARREPFMPSWEELIVMMGCTTIIYTCACGAIRSFRCLGKTASADVLERML